MHRHAAAIAREALAAEPVEAAIGMNEFTLIGRLERLVRRAGAEDLVAMVSDGQGHFRPATAQIVGRNTSIMAAVEYSGHWAKVARNFAGLTSPLASMQRSGHVETLSTSYPWRPIDPQAPPDAAVVALQVELDGADGVRLFHGDTYVRHVDRMELL